eukprot:GHUV01037496.1.p1 GENE.GHUV01037496.1~~GHUV01037496.1.p1  ORF type:complete len:488 (+),score=100.34 GHUV01037496.1:242-1705(+)
MATTKHHLLHLVAWAQIGVILRVYLGLLFGSACGQLGWAPCVTSPGTRNGGAVFTDLPANVLGSFLMGLFVSSDVLSSSLKHTLTVEAPLAMAPVNSPLQAHLPFQVGLRTGLCGSLTTFASWNLQMVIMLVGGRPIQTVDGPQWVDGIAGLIVGTLCAMAALVAGQHMALMLYHKLNPGAFIPYSAPVREQLERVASRQSSKGLVVDGNGPSRLQQMLGQYEEQMESSTEPDSFVNGHPRRVRLRTYSCPAPGHHKAVLQIELAKQQFVPRASSIPDAADGDAAERIDSTAEAVAAGEEGLITDGSASTAGLPVPAAAADSAQQLQPPAATDAQRSPFQATQLQQHHAAVPTYAFGRTVSQHRAGSAHYTVDTRALSAEQRQQASSELGAIPAEDIPADDVTVSVSEEEEDDSKPYVQPFLPSVAAVDAFAGAVAVVLTGISLWRIIHGSIWSDLVSMHDPFAAQWIWWAVLFGPIGCYIRYYLAR